MKKIIALALLALTAALPLLGCSSKAAAEPAFDDVVAAVDSAISNEGTLVSVNEDYIGGAMKMDVSGYESYCVKINAYGANIDEYGVFKGADGDEAKEIKSAVEAYLQMREDTWMVEYMPEEHPKLLAAEIESKGSYVMYAILGDGEKTAAFDAFEGCFK